MAKDESFLLLSLSDSKAKKVAQVVNNESCRKILDYLAKVKSSTETKIADELKIPLPTAHYNLKQLVDVKLVNIDEFHYSEKGKEVNHYSLANKYIIIAPREEQTILDKLKKILPAFLALVGASFIIRLFDALKGAASSSKEMLAAKSVAEADTALLQAAPASLQGPAQAPDFALWFFLGGICALLIYFIVDWLKNK